MRTIDVMAQILKKEGVQFLSAFPTTPVIEACAEAGIRPVICRQERVGVGIADGFTRVTNANPPGAFAMQYGPGAENAYAGVATAFSDAVPMLLLPLGHPKSMDGVFPHFSSLRNYAPITKHIEQVKSPERIAPTLRRAFAAMKMGRPGPAMVEIPVDVATAQVDSALAENYQPMKETMSQGNPDDVLAAAKALLKAKAPIIHAGQGVLYAEATDELIELAELLQTPVMTTMSGKSAFPENHPLALGSGSGVMSGPVYHFLKDADVLFAIGTSLTRHLQVTTIPPGKTIIHATNDPIDISKDYVVGYPVIGDAKLVLRQFIEACRDLLGKQKRNGRVTAEIVRIREQWLKEWMPRLTSNEVPLSPYRVIHEFIQNIRPTEAIVTHDSGSPRDQIMPFYKTDGPRTYIGWGKSHGLGTGLGLIMGAKLAQPDKFCVNFMGDAAFGMVGTDFETAVRSGIPICTVVLNNSSMACETVAMASSHRLYNARDLGGNYADMASAMGGWSERVTDPGQIADAVKRARKATESGRAALLEFITKQETNNSYKYVFNK